MAYNSTYTGQQVDHLLDLINQLQSTPGSTSSSLVGFRFIGVAQPSSTAIRSSSKIFYVANGAGNYVNFGGISVSDGEFAFLCWNGNAWSKSVVTIASLAELAALKANVGYHVCNSTANAAIKVVDSANFVLTQNCRLVIKMTNINNADNASLSINGTASKPLYYKGSIASSTNTWKAEEYLDVFYDGTNYQATPFDGSGDFNPNAVYPNLTAGYAINIQSREGDGIDDLNESFVFRSSGGDTSISDGVARILSLVGTANFPNITQFISTGYNAAVGKLAGYKINGNNIVEDSTYALIYFRNIACQSGAGKNNGYVIKTKGQGTNVGITLVSYYNQYIQDWDPTQGKGTGSISTLNPVDDGDGYYRYVPSSRGYILITVPIAYMDLVCASLAWSGYRDADWESPSQSILAIENPHTWGFGQVGLVKDENDYTNLKQYVRIDRFNLAEAEWSGAEGEWTANISEELLSTSISLEGTAASLSASTDGTLTCTDSTAPTSGYVYYQKGDPIERDLTSNGNYTVSDFGTEEFILVNINNAPIASFTYFPNLVDVLRGAEERFTNLEDKVTELELASGYYAIGEWDTNSLSPVATKVYGDTSVIENTPFLIDMTDNTEETTLPKGELMRNNILKYVTGEYAPVVLVKIAGEGQVPSNTNGYLDGTVWSCTNDVWTNLVDISIAYGDYTGTIAAGTFNATTLLTNLRNAGVGYGSITATYNDGSDNIPINRFPRPWESTTTTYSVMTGNKVTKYVIDGVGNNGKTYKGISNGPINWNGIEAIELPPTAMSPGPVTTLGGKSISRFIAYKGGDSVTNSGNGHNSVETVFPSQLGTYPRVSFSQPSFMTAARKNNADNTKPYPWAEGGFHAINAAILGQEVLYGTNYIFAAAKFGSGISANDACNSEATFLANGGTRYKVTGGSTWSYCGWGGTLPIKSTSSASTTNASNFFNQYYPKEMCLESQTVLSYAVDNNIAPNTEFTFMGMTYTYKDVPGCDPLLSGGKMNAILYKKMTFTMSAFNNSGEATDYDIELRLRMSVYDGLNLSGDIFAYWGGGCEIIGTSVNPVSTSRYGNPNDIYIEPDQRKWHNIDTISLDAPNKFAFESTYHYMGRYIDATNGYTKTRLGMTPWRLVAASGLSNGCCYYNYLENYWGTTVGKRVRRALLLRGHALLSSCSPRFLYSNASAGITDARFGGSAQVLIRH